MPSSSIRTGRPSNLSDRRRGRSRSPSAYLKKSGRSIKGFLSHHGGSKGHNKSSSSNATTVTTTSVGGRSAGSNGGMYVPKIKPPSPTSVMMDATEPLQVSSPMSDASGMEVEVKLRETKVEEESTPPAVVQGEETTKQAEGKDEVVATVTKSVEDVVEEGDDVTAPAAEAADAPSSTAEEHGVDGGDVSGTDDEVEEAASGAVIVAHEDDVDAAVYDVVVEDPAPAPAPTVAEDETEKKVMAEVSTAVADEVEEEAEAVEPKKTKEVEPEVKPVAEESTADTTEGPPSIEVDAREEDPAVIDTPSKTETMQLLLIEPSTRSFEFLQLEFRPDRALVQDILCQVAVTATEEALRGQEYVSICTLRGKEMDCGSQLLDFVSGGHRVALAVPLGLSGVDVARLAAPILQDPKIKTVFNSISEEEVDTTAKNEDQQQRQQQPPVPPKLELGQMAREDRDAAASTAPPAAASDDDATATEEEVPAPKKVSRSPFVPPILPRENAPEKKLASKTKPAAPAVAEKEEVAAIAPAPSSTPMLILLAITVFAAVVPPGVILLHQHISSPLRPGDVLPAGRWRNRCGLLSLVPSDWLPTESSVCADDNEATIVMGRDGVLTMYEGGGGCPLRYILGEGGTASWRISPSSLADEGDAGLRVLDDGRVVTMSGGQTRFERLSSSSSSTQLSPWPFEVEPRWKSTSPRQESKEGSKKRNPLLGIFQRK